MSHVSDQENSEWVYADADLFLSEGQESLRAGGNFSPNATIS